VELVKIKRINGRSRGSNGSVGGISSSMVSNEVGVNVVIQIGKQVMVRYSGESKGARVVIRGAKEVQEPITDLDGIRILVVIAGLRWPGP